MELVSAIVSALAVGASAGLTSTGEAAVKDAYETVRGFLRDRFSGIDVAQLEKSPDSRARQKVLSEELEVLDVLNDGEFLEKVSNLIELIEVAGPQLHDSIGVDLEEIKAANLVITRVTSTGSGVQIRKAEIRNDITIHDVHSGPDGNAKPAKKKE